jgi:transglutaminase-like putative cysteine protease
VKRWLAARPGLWIASACALAALPGDRFSVSWLALFSLPGVAALLVARRARHGPRWAEPIGLALLLEVGLAFALFELGGRPRPEVALTYTLLAPLAFLLLRGQMLDGLHALFLGLCLVVIGAMLRGAVPVVAVAGFAAAAALALQNELRRALRGERHALRAGHAPKLARAGGALGVTAACLLAALGLFEAMQLVPAPGKPSAARDRAAGLSNAFDLRARSGNPLNLVDDELVDVSGIDGERLPSELYLRSGYFDVPHAEHWSVAPVRLARRALDDWQIADAIDGVRIARLALQRLGDCDGFVFLPPGAHRLRAERTLSLAANEREHFAREPQASGSLAYEVDGQDLRQHADRRLSARGDRHLTALPDAFLDDRYRALAAEWTRGVRATPAALAGALIERLQERCRYELREPTGPHRATLDNFLFGDRFGYCMHFATALCVLLRHAGVPCRIGVGLYGRTANVPRRGVLTLGSKHAHAWTEIPLDGLGWVVFDATPPAGLLSAVGRFPETSANDEARSPMPDAEDEDLASSLLAKLRALPFGRVWPWLALLALCALPVLRRSRQPRAGGAPRQSATERSARRWLGRILHALAKGGLPRPRGCTLERFAALLTARAGERAPPIAAAFAAYQEVRFGARPFDALREKTLAAGLEAARQVR